VRRFILSGFWGGGGRGGSFLSGFGVGSFWSAGDDGGGVVDIVVGSGDCATNRGCLFRWLVEE